MVAALLSWPQKNKGTCMMGQKPKRKAISKKKPRHLEQTLDRLTKQLGKQPAAITLSLSRPDVIKADMTALRLYYHQLVKNQKLARRLEKQLIGRSANKVKGNGPVYALLQIYKHINEVIDATQALRTSEEKHSLLVNNVLNPLFDQLVTLLVRTCKRQKEVLELTTELQTLYDRSVDRVKTLSEDEL